MKTKRKRSFQPGRSGACEALLYEFRGRPVPDGDEEETVPTEKIAAADIHEALAYIRRRHADFEVWSVRLAGVIVLLSGSPLD